MRLWIDTDVGSDVDDALTLGYALRHPGIDLVGVSTVFGDVALRSRIARRLLEIASADHVPVVTGLGAPLTPGRKGRMFGHEGLGLFEDPAPEMRTESDEGAADRIDELASALEAARPDAILSIGPMTNLGALARAGHRLPALTVMGGKIADVELPGTLPQIPEWNWWCDPQAVASVLESPQAAPPRIVPIEVTISTVLPEDDWSSLAAGDDLARTLGVLCEEWMRALRERLAWKRPQVHLHDPLAAMTLVEPDVCEYAAKRIRVDDAGVTHEVADGARVEAAETVDLHRLRAQLMDAWLGRSA